jgi:hypothetical protein
MAPAARAARAARRAGARGRAGPPAAAPPIYDTGLLRRCGLADAARLGLFRGCAYRVASYSCKRMSTESLGATGAAVATAALAACHVLGTCVLLANSAALLAELKAIRAALSARRHQSAGYAAHEERFAKEGQDGHKPTSAEAEAEQPEEGGAARVTSQGSSSSNRKQPPWCLKLSQIIPLFIPHPPNGDTSGEDPVKMTPVMGRLDHFTVDSTNHRLFLACLGADCVLVIDTFAGKVVAVLNGRQKTSDVPGSQEPGLSHPQVTECHTMR